MTRGDIWTVDFPLAQGSPGHEQAVSRPAVVVQADSSHGSLPTVTVVPMTGQLDAARFPRTFRVDPSDANGLTRSTVVLAFQLRAVDSRRLLRRIGALEPHHLALLEEEMRVLLGM